MTRTITVALECPECNQTMKAKHYTILLLKEYPKLKRKFIDTSFFERHCPHCKKTFMDFYPMIYVDEVTGAFFNVALAEAHFDNLIRSSYQRVDEMLAFMKMMNSSRCLRYIADAYELSEKIALIQAHYDDRMFELMKYHMVQKLNENGENIDRAYYRNTDRGVYLLALRKDGTVGTIPFEEMWYQAVVKSYRTRKLPVVNKLEHIDQNWAKTIIRPMQLVEEGEGISIQ